MERIDADSVYVREFVKFCLLCTKFKSRTTIKVIHPPADGRMTELNESDHCSQAKSDSLRSLLHNYRI